MVTLLEETEEDVMYARVVKVEVNPDNKDETTRIFNEVIKSAGKVDGFEGGMLLIDPGTGKGMSITLWQSEQVMLETEQSGWWQQQVDRFKNVFLGPPLREHYVVTFSELPGELGSDKAKKVQGEKEIRVGT
jgi:heme-degrading monooxygenase HmoA